MIFTVNFIEKDVNTNYDIRLVGGRMDDGIEK